MTGRLRRGASTGGAGASSVQAHHGVAAGRDIRDNVIHVGLDAEATGRLIREAVHPTLRLTRFEARAERARQTDSDAVLLSAYRTDVVQMLGRDAVMADLRAWADSKQDISIRVVTGAGGRGKTRLALELARTLGGQGWLAGFVTDSELDRFRGQARVAEWVWNAPTLVVVDYAAKRAAQLRGWIDDLVDARSEFPLRLLLLERQAQREIGWLADMVGLGQNESSRAAQSLLDPPEPVELAEIDDTVFRREIFTTVLSRRRKDLPVPLPGADPEFDRLLMQEKWAGNPLFLMMAGLVAAEAGVHEALARRRTDLAAIIAQRELDRIGGIAAGRGVDAADQSSPGFAARHMAVMATLAQGLALTDARTLATEELSALGSGASIDGIMAALRDALPPDDGSNPEIASIIPDIVGEATILIWLGSGGTLEARGVDVMRSLRRLAASYAQVSATLMRTAQDFAATGREEPVRWLYAIVQDAEADLGALMQIAGQLPDQTLALRELAADLTRLIVSRLRSQAADRERETAAFGRIGQLLSWIGHALIGSRPPLRDSAIPSIGRLAAGLNNLGLRLSNLGRREEALTANQEAVDIYRRLAQSRPDAFLPDLAMSLNNTGAMLSNLGRREEALAASQEAVEIYRRLAQSRPDAFLPDLAGSLNNLGIRLSNLGRHEEALFASQEAVDIYRRLAQSRPDAFLPDLAMSLNNLGNRLSDLGRREEALAASQEAVDIYRRLAQSRPDAFLPDLAMSLNNLGNRLSALGRREEALAASREAVDIRRRLAQSRPDAFLPNLASSLNNTGNMLSNLGRHEEAMAASQEAVDIYRRLAQSRPDAFLPDLASSLNNLGGCLSNLGRHEEALVASQESVDIRRRLAQGRPDAFLPNLAMGLNNLGNSFSNLGRREEALAASQEAVDIYRRLAQSRSDAFLPDLAISLNNTGNMLSNLGRHEEALVASQESVDIRRRLAQGRPDAFLPDLATSVSVLSDILAALERYDDAAQAAHEALRLLLPYVQRYPATYRGLARTILADIERYGNAAGTAPDRSLIAQAARLISPDGRQGK
ncbi:tetratricopeptide repeat protein [Bradyrhizobium sp. HKCCYLRH3099]|uniref:tetratricopeptide repeat protein n=1 Tax=unclassified Bradyrhizobium TaxID=2631580 RepID=UPI003EBBFE68